MLVVLFFMDVKYCTKLTKLTVISRHLHLSGLIGMTLADYMSRAWGQSWQEAAFSSQLFSF